MQTSSDPSADVAVRLADRYPAARTPRAVVIGAVAVVAAMFLGWLIWTAWLHANPVVSGAVNSFTITSDQQTDITLTVQRRDPSVPVSCRVIVQAENFETVGEKNIAVGASDHDLVDVKESIRTLRRGTSASLRECVATG